MPEFTVKCSLARLGALQWFNSQTALSNGPEPTGNLGNKQGKQANKHSVSFLGASKPVNVTMSERAYKGIIKISGLPRVYACVKTAFPR